MASAVLLAACGPVEDRSGSAPPADERGLGGCRDADCDVEVEPDDRLPLDPAWGVDAITVDTVADDEITLALEGSSGGFDLEGGSITATSNCVNGVCQDLASLTLTTHQPVRINDLEMLLVSAGEGRAIVRLRPA